MTDALHVAVLGAAGRMGSEAVKAVEAAEDMKLVAALGRGDSLEQAAQAGATHLVDLTLPEATQANVEFAMNHGIHAVVGATGWDEPARRRLATELESHPELGVLIAPNFALGAVLASRFSAAAAKYFESAEIIELHHPQKVDAPSGTAARTAELMAASRQAAGVGPSPDATAEDPLGARGGVIDGIHVHSVRLRGLVAHQQTLLGSAGEQLTIRHDSFDRASFMPGVLLGLRTVASRPGLTYGLDAYLDLSF